MPTTKSTLPHDIPRTIDLRLAPNLVQASGIVLLSFVGAFVGYHAVNVGQWIAAAAGGVAGMVVATLISGVTLMFMPAAATSDVDDEPLSGLDCSRLRVALPETADEHFVDCLLVDTAACLVCRAALLRPLSASLPLPEL